MSTLIKRMLCNHKWKQMNVITVVCENCGAMKRIPCCHDWELVSESSIRGGGGGYTHFNYDLYVYMCKNCGEIIKVKNI